jgi:hypothetical protein
MPCYQTGKGETDSYDIDGYVKTAEQSWSVVFSDVTYYTVLPNRMEKGYGSRRAFERREVRISAGAQTNLIDIFVIFLTSLGQILGSTTISSICDRSSWSVLFSFGEEVTQSIYLKLM